MSFDISKLFSDCLMWLADSAWSSVTDIHDGLLDGLNTVGTQFLEHVLEAEPNPLQDTRGLILLPAVGTRLPFLHLVHGSEHGHDTLRMTLVVVGPDEAGSLASAWRFESPEGPGEHCYWHCQPVRRLRGSAQPPPLERLPRGFFDDVPTIPVAAGNPDELLVSMLVAVYGHATLGRMQREGFQDRLHGQLTGFCRTD